MGRAKRYMFCDLLADIIDAEPAKASVKPYKENEALRNAQEILRQQCRKKE